jgi:hypothetical protein
MGHERGRTNSYLAYCLLAFHPRARDDRKLAQKIERSLKLEEVALA